MSCSFCKTGYLGCRSAHSSSFGRNEEYISGVCKADGFEEADDDARKTACIERIDDADRSSFGDWARVFESCRDSD